MTLHQRTTREPAGYISFPQHVLRQSGGEPGPRTDAVLAESRKFFDVWMRGPSYDWRRPPPPHTVAAELHHSREQIADAYFAMQAVKRVPPSGDSDIYLAEYVISDTMGQSFLLYENLRWRWLMRIGRDGRAALHERPDIDEWYYTAFANLLARFAHTYGERAGRLTRMLGDIGQGNSQEAAETIENQRSDLLRQMRRFRELMSQEAQKDQHYSSADLELIWNAWKEGFLSANPDAPARVKAFALPPPP